MFARLFAMGAVILWPYVATADVSVDFRTVPNGVYSSLLWGGIQVTGSSSVVSTQYFNARGLGILGPGTLSGADFSLDVGETMTIDFGASRTGVRARINDILPVGNVTFGFTAFNGGSTLGTFMFPAATVSDELYDVYALAGNRAMTGFTIFVESPSAPYGLQVQEVSYSETVPEPGTLLLTCTGLAALCLCRLRARRSR